MKEVKTGADNKPPSQLIDDSVESFDEVIVAAAFLSICRLLHRSFTKWNKTAEWGGIPWRDLCRYCSTGRSAISIYQTSPIQDSHLPGDRNVGTGKTKITSVVMHWFTCPNAVSNDPLFDQSDEEIRNYFYQQFQNEEPGLPTAISNLLWLRLSTWSSL